MEINIVKDRIATFIGSWGRREYLVIGLLVLIMLYLWLQPGVKPDNSQQIINDLKATMEKQYAGQLKEKEVQITDYKNRLVVSEGKYKVLVKRYNDLQKEKENVKPPTTNAELRDRFTALGYPPLPVK